MFSPESVFFYMDGNPMDSDVFAVSLSEMILFVFLIQVERLPEGAEFVYSFWVGMPYFTQVHILDLCACSDTVSTLVVFRDGKWRKSDQVLQILKAPGPRWWNLFRTVVASMSRSGERKTAWVFRCE